MSGAASIGLDLGAGKCCVASVRAGAVTVLPNAHGDKTTPSFVAFTDSRSLVGSDARDQAALNATNTVYGVKTILGRSFRDPVVQNYVSYNPVKVVDDGGKPVMEVEYRGGSLHVAPELVAAMQLLKMRQEAKIQVGDIGGVVVAVPASYSNTQREALVAACQIAGLPLLDLISETTATALAYWHNRGPSVAQQTILVFDMGATKLDVSVIQVGEKEIRVLAVCGDDSFGGENFDQELMTFVDYDFEDKHSKSLLDKPRSKLRLKLACENLKKKLTLLQSFWLNEDNIQGELPLNIFVQRKQFQRLFVKILSMKLDTILGSVLQDAGLTKDQIDEVVVVGGSSRVPFISDFLQTYFGRNTLNKTVNADESVACGAAIRADQLNDNDTTQVIAISEMVQDPVRETSLQAAGFKKYLVATPGMKCDVIRRELNNNNAIAVKSSYTLGSHGVFDAVTSVFYQNVENEIVEGKLENKFRKDLEITEMKKQLNQFEFDRITVENDSKALNELEEICHETAAGLICLQQPSGAEGMEKLITELLSWIDDNEDATVALCAEKKSKILEAWKKLNKELIEICERNLVKIIRKEQPDSEQDQNKTTFELETTQEENNAEDEPTENDQEKNEGVSVEMEASAGDSNHRENDGISDDKNWSAKHTDVSEKTCSQVPKTKVYGNTGPSGETINRGSTSPAGAFKDCGSPDPAEAAKVPGGTCHSRAAKDSGSTGPAGASKDSGSTAGEAKVFGDTGNQVQRSEALRGFGQSEATNASGHNITQTGGNNAAENTNAETKKDKSKDKGCVI
ncbi:hypothetical protein HAZT_HAZT004044 [Hyalella azteca]|uniref:Uncharacterized protein n=1 Tax=Hyalella azteca TaxID=294128 RepID=A0A6A0H8Q8_HYAAZ|nr:hypothetical protein HAZT_HAZT004044 [Hyalella azteca]